MQIVKVLPAAEMIITDLVTPWAWFYISSIVGTQASPTNERVSLELKESLFKNQWIRGVVYG